MKLIFTKHFLTRQWRWKIKSNNGKIICASSESFFNKGDCVRNSQLTAKAINEHFE